MRTPRLIAALALPLVLAAGLSACGSDEGEGAEQSSAVETTETAGESPSESPTESPTATEMPTETPTDAPTASPTEEVGADWPACGEVWVDDARMPGGYAGCREGDTAVPAEKRGCAFGRPLITYDGRFWGVPTGIVHEADGPLERDRAYQSDLASCTG